MLLAPKKSKRVLIITRRTYGASLDISLVRNAMRTVLNDYEYDLKVGYKTTYKDENDQWGTMAAMYYIGYNARYDMHCYIKEHIKTWIGGLGKNEIADIDVIDFT